MLSNFEPPATEDEIEAAALQYVRKVSGATKPSAANQEAFDEAVRVVAEATRALLEELVIKAPPRDRETEAAKAKARAAERYGPRAAATASSSLAAGTGAAAAMPNAVSTACTSTGESHLASPGASAGPPASSITVRSADSSI